MGCERALEGCMRSSVELRRVKNAKITAARNRKWQEARLQREQEEKKAVEEILNRRKRERARLASYIYSSTQNAAKAFSDKSQGSLQHVIEDNMIARDTRSGNVGDMPQKISRSKVVDAHGLSSLSIVNEPSDLHLRDGGMEKSEVVTEFLEEALHERLQNEEATSLLIAEITDMKSRLDDCLSKPVNNHKDLPVRGSTGTRGPLDSDGGNMPPQCFYEHERPRFCKADENVTFQRNTVESDKEEVKNVDHGTNYINKSTGNDGSYLNNAAINSDNKENIDIGRRVTAACKSFQSCNDLIKEHTLSNNILQDPHKEQCSNRVFSQFGSDQNGRTLTIDNSPNCLSKKKSSKSDHELPRWNKPYNILSLNLGQAYRTYSIQRSYSNQYSKNPVLCSAKKKKEFTDEEKSILASIERLDVKLSIISAKMSNSSRTSLMSEDLKSTKSAPITSNKSGSDSYSISNGMLPIRPTTANTRGILPTSRRRHAVGLTNMSKERNNQFQPTVIQKLRTSLVFSSDNQIERRQKSNGTIVLHQNAEFLFR